MRNHRITFFTDNATLVDTINRATSRDVTVMMFVCRLVLACLQFDIQQCCVHQKCVSRFLILVAVLMFKQLALRWVTVIADRHTVSSNATEMVNTTS